MHSRFSPRIAGSVLAVLALGFSLTSCTSDVEKSPAFSSMAKKLKDLEESQKKTAQSVESQYMSVDVLNDDVKAIKTAMKAQSPTGDATKDLAAAMERVAKLEQQVAALQQSLAAVKAAPAPAPAASPAKAAPALQPAAGRTPAPATAPAPKPRVEKKAAGAYYRVREGDTLEGIAKAHKVSVAQIQQANRLPAGKEVPAGQSLFIPSN